MNLESIVPSLETCRKIPQGSFPNSALVWYSDKEGHFVQSRDPVLAAIICPAPTLAEIMEEIATVGCFVRVCEVGGNVEYTASLPLSDIEETNTNPATAALRLWFRMKGVQG